jgi:hypothetical protein
MTRKHFIAFANALASHQDVAPSRDWEDHEHEAWEAGYETARQDIGRSIAAILRLENDRFDAARFFAAAKLD